MTNESDNNTRLVRVPLGNGKYTYVGKNDPQNYVNKPATDSGQISRYEPSQHTKTTGPIAKFIGWVQSKFITQRDLPESGFTTEQGAQSSASPSVYQFTLWQQRYERRAVVQECRQAYNDDPRVNKSCNMFAYEAVRGGAIITFNDTFRMLAGDARAFSDASLAKTDLPTMTSQSANKVRGIAKDIQNLVNPLLNEWATMEIVEGESFIQAVVAGESGNARIVAVKRMPTDSMERNTDDSDEFVDVDQAFSQVDIMTNEEVATFPLALVYHSRWRHVDGTRYGMSEINSIRRSRRLLLLMEEAQTRRRIARATKRVHWEFGYQTKDDYITPDPAVIENFKNNNGFKSGIREQFDPTEIGRDTFGFGVKPVDFAGDDHISDIEDLLYFQNLVTVGCPTPAVLYNLDSKSANQYTLEDQRAEWLKQTTILSERMKEIVQWLMDLALLLQDIVPETVKYSVKFSESNIETPSAMIKRVIDARACQIGSGRAAVPAPLISQYTALMNVAEHFNVSDVEAEDRMIAAELQAIAQGILEEHNNTYSTNDPANESNATAPNKTKSKKAAELHAFGRYARPTAQTGKPKPKGSKPTNAEATAKYTGVGQTSAKFGSVYGVPNSEDYNK